MKELLDLFNFIFQKVPENSNKDTFRRNYIYLAKLNRFMLETLDTINTPRVQEISSLILSINSSNYLSTEEKKMLLFAILKINIISLDDITKDQLNSNIKKEPLDTI